ncbi:hypothetical protein Tco_0477659 [Tanacetum coccineum]
MTTFGTISIDFQNGGLNPQTGWSLGTNSDTTVWPRGGSLLGRDSAFRKRFRSSYESSPSSSPPDLLLRKRYRGTSELVEDEDDEEEDE